MCKGRLRRQNASTWSFACRHTTSATGHLSSRGPGAGAPGRSRQQVRPEHERAALPQELLKDLPVGQALLDLAGDELARRVGGAAAVGVAARQRVEVPGADVPLDAAGAVDVRQEPLDALL